MDKTIIVKVDLKGLNRCQSLMQLIQWKFNDVLNNNSMRETNPLATFETLSALEADFVGSEISAALEMSASVMSFEHETRISGCVPPNVKV